MMTENTAIEAMHRALREARDAKKRIEARLLELETEAAMIRSQMTSLDLVIDQTSSALRSALFPTESFAPPAPPMQAPTPQPPPVPNYLQQRAAPPAARQPFPPLVNVPQQEVHQAAIELEDLEAIEAGLAAQRLNATGNVRFNDFRIPQAATIVLREAGGPLHVSDIYQRMAEGGFEFRGQHQLITLAVSLSRAKRFRKVAPGTFELDPRYATGQVA